MYFPLVIDLLKCFFQQLFELMAEQTRIFYSDNTDKSRWLFPFVDDKKCIKFADEFFSLLKTSKTMIYNMNGIVWLNIVLNKVKINPFLLKTKEIEGCFGPIIKFTVYLYVWIGVSPCYTKNTFPAFFSVSGAATSSDATVERYLFSSFSSILLSTILFMPVSVAQWVVMACKAQGRGFDSREAHGFGPLSLK